MDDVVQSYHNGFNKAIHNYSRILRLFSESKDQASLQRWASPHTHCGCPCETLWPEACRLVSSSGRLS